MSPITWTALLLAGVTCVFGLGQQTNINNHPSIVQIEDRVGTLWLQQGVASVLTNFHLLTAASGTHSGNSQRIRGRAGTSTRGSGGIVSEVAAVIIHEDYGSMDHVADVAIIRLVNALPLGSSIAQAQILGPGIELPVNLQLTLASWGTTTEGGLIGDSNLYSLDLYVVSNDQCTEAYLTGDNSRVVTDTMLCAGRTFTSGRDFDSRDVGAPLFYQGVTVGVLSFGVSRGGDQYPLVSTHVGSYTNWILENAQ